MSKNLSNFLLGMNKSEVSESHISDLKSNVPVHIFAMKNIDLKMSEMSLVDLLLRALEIALEMPVCLNSKGKVVSMEDSDSLLISD